MVDGADGRRNVSAALCSKTPLLDPSGIADVCEGVLKERLRRCRKVEAQNIESISP